MTIDIAAVMISSEERKAVRDATLSDLRSSDWGTRQIEVLVSDSKTSVSRKDAMVLNSKRALEKGKLLGTDYILFLEDDLLFNRHLVHNLSRWAPVRSAQITVASIYDPGVFSVFRNRTERYFIAHPLQVYGSQAFLIATPTIDYLVAHWSEVHGLQDIRISRLAARLQKPIFYHDPSLIQHIGKVSTWGGKFHCAASFDPGWLCCDDSEVTLHE